MRSTSSRPFYFAPGAKERARSPKENAPVEFHTALTLLSARYSGKRIRTDR